MIINTYNTFLNIEGFQYPCRVKYQGMGDDMEILDVEVRNEDKEWIGMPFLKKVDDHLRGDIWECNGD
jgi:hypothetical protein